MLFKDMPIQKKLLRGIILISGTVLLVTCTTFFTYEYYKFRQSSMEKLSTIGKIISANSTAALAFTNLADAKEILASLKSEPHIVAACFYDKDGNKFSQYPSGIDIAVFPARPESDGYRFAHSHLEGFEPVVEGDKRLGTLYLKSDLEDMYERFQLYGIITSIVIVVSFALAYLLSRILQKSIATPILALADTAKVISEQKDYSVRAVKLGNDELGLLTDAFNQMLIQIQEQNQSLSEFNKKLEQKVIERTQELENANKNLKSHANQLKESEEKYRELFENAHDMIQGIDAKGNILFVNNAWKKILGYSDEEIKMKNIFEIIHPDCLQHCMNIFERISKGENIDDFEIEFMSKEKQKVITRGSTTVKMKNGEFISTRGIFHDVTESKKAENAIRQLNKELAHNLLQVESVNKELESFSYSVSHDLRAPVRAVHGYSQILLEDYKNKLDEEGLRLLNIVMYNAVKMGKLIDDLLEFSRLGKRELNKTKINMNEIAEGALRDLQQSTRHQAEIIIHPMPPANADYGLVFLVYQNLISNAIKYSSKNENPKIEIGMTDTEKGKAYFVKDNGAGFNMKYYDKLFGVFQRLHSQEEFTGTGVGLAIVQRVILRHKGLIWAESEMGKGATFYFTLEMKFNNVKTTNTVI